MANKEATRYASSVQEKRVASKLGGKVSSNSGAGLFNKGDIVCDDASLLIECKTCMEPKKSFSIKKDWIEKDAEEAFRLRLDNHVIAFNFDYQDKNDYYVIDDKLMGFLVQKLEEENEREFRNKLP